MVTKNDRNYLTSSVHEKQPTVEGENSHGSSEQQLTDSKVVSVQDVKQISVVYVEHTSVVNEATQIAESGDGDVVLSQIFGQSLNVFDDSEIQWLIEDDPVEFQSMVEERASTTTADETLIGLRFEKFTFLKKESTTQMSIPLRKGDSI